MLKDPLRRIQSSVRRVTKQQRRGFFRPFWKAEKGKTTTLQHANDDNDSISAVKSYSPFRMYLSCMGIVLLWVTTGTLFYSICNDWPLPQSFFYAIDAGMSIGFCTEVAETKLTSKAFTIVYILLGASVVGGSLTLFLQDALEDLSNPSVDEYRLLLDQQVFGQADLDKSGTLNFEEFRSLMRSTTTQRRRQQMRLAESNQDPTKPFDTTDSTTELSETDIERLFTKFDRLNDGVIHFEEFTAVFQDIDRLIEDIQSSQPQSTTATSQTTTSLMRPIVYSRKLLSNPFHHIASSTRHFVAKAWELSRRIYVVCILWIGMGIGWGMLDQKWDPITATHFAISALATGGLTAPHVNPQDGILPPEPAIFCGVFCLFGIPLLALSLGHFATTLVGHHVASLEREALTRPISPVEYQVASRLTTNDNLVHRSDFIVLQLLRQGKLSKSTIDLLTQNFDLLDTKNRGVITLKQATMSSGSA